MLSSRRRRTGTGSSSLPFPRRGRALALIAILLAALAEVLWWAGWHDSKQLPWQTNWDIPLIPQLGDIAEWLSDWLARLYEGIAWVLTGRGGAPLSVRLVCLTLLIALLWAWRRWLLARNAYKPGPVDVQKLAAAMPEGQPNPPVVDDLTERFRKQLSETILYPPSMLPVEAPAESFLDLLGDVDTDPKKLTTSLLRLVSKIRPKIAYRVSGVLQFRDEQPCCGVTVTITSYATRGTRMETFWGRTWEHAVDAAGYWVISSLVPVTRACKNPPWQDWRGRDLPGELFAAYQEARELAFNRQLDEALKRYFEALDRDPMNLQIRAQIAATQEKMGLYLDALETYLGALSLVGKSIKQQNSYLWLSPWRPGRFLRLRHLWGWHGVLEARHRYAVVLAAERTAHQWCKGRDPWKDDKRGLAREQIRKSLTPALVDRYWRAVVDLAAIEKINKKKEPKPRRGKKGTMERIERGARHWLAETLNRCDEDEVRRVFRRACAQEMYRLTEDHLIARAFRGNRPPISLTRRSLRINRDVWAPLQLARAGGHGALLTPHRWLLGWRPKHLKNANTIKLPENADDLYLKVDKARRPYLPTWANWFRFKGRDSGWPWRLRRNRWQDSYNAACVYGVAMPYSSNELLSKRRQLYDILNLSCDQRDFGTLASSVAALVDLSAEDDRAAKLTELAVAELECAMRTAESGFMTLRKSWLIYEDPDLVRVRSMPAFVHFERDVYPYSTPDHCHAPEAIQIEMAVYERQMLADIAKAMKHTWQLRKQNPSTDPHTLATWFQNEHTMWDRVDLVAASGGRYWQHRVNLLRRARECADPTLMCTIKPRVPVFDDDDLVSLFTDEPESLDFKKGTAEVLIWLGSDVKLSIGQSKNWLEKISSANRFGINSPSTAQVRKACTQFEDTWRKVEEECRAQAVAHRPGMPSSADKRADNFGT